MGTFRKPYRLIPGGERPCSASMEGVNRFVVGILGGMGSYSTLHFFEQLLDAFPAEKEWERPRIIVDNNCVLPSRVRAILYDEGRADLVDGMASSIRGLLAYEPDLIAIPCNTAHFFLPEVRAKLSVPDRVLDMLEVTAAHCEAEGLKEIFLLATEGTIETRIYERYFDAHGVRVINPSAAELAEIRAFIEQVKQRAPLDVTGFRAFLDARPGDAVVLGCTELSSFFPSTSEKRQIDPVTQLVERIHALSLEKKT
jgi:aspartate racemase